MVHYSADFFNCELYHLVAEKDLILKTKSNSFINSVIKGVLLVISYRENFRVGF